MSIKSSLGRQLGTQFDTVFDVVKSNPIYDKAGGSIPSLDLNFAKSKSLLDGRSTKNKITFTRASSGTYVGSDGLIKTATTNEARFDHDPATGESLGLLIEEARTNYLTQSENFGLWTITTASGSTYTNQATSPDGSNAFKIIPDSGATSSILNAPSGANYESVIYSVYVKAAEFDWINVSYYASSSFNNWFNVKTGQLGTTSRTCEITPAGNGWYRCVVYGNTTNQNFLSLKPGSSNGVAAVGDGVSGIYVWGAQGEIGSFPTSYIPTTSSTVTRAADVASITGSNFSSWYRQDEGTVFVNQTSLSTVPQDFATVFRFNDATATNVLFIRKRSGFSQWVASGENSLFMTRTISQPSVLSVVYKTDDAAFAAEGTLTNDDSCTIDPNKVEVLIGSASGSTSYMNGTIRRLTYWPQRLPNETLQTITQ
jgi:hypothetical protein